jgi:glutaredoxin-related protein
MSKKSFYAKAINIEIMNLYVEGKFINSGFEILTDSLEQGPYYIIVDVADRMELWSINSQKPLSDKLDYIYIQDLSEKNPYYVGMKNNKEAIFHKDSKKPITCWYDEIPIKILEKFNQHKTKKIFYD